jgi:hypothetical protein
MDYSHRAKPRKMTVPQIFGVKKRRIKEESILPSNAVTYFSGNYRPTIKIYVTPIPMVPKYYFDG